jgi:hypothetical protein
VEDDHGSLLGGQDSTGGKREAVDPVGGDMTSLALVVARDRPDLYESLRRDFMDTTRLTIILDRRHGERRRQSVPIDQERRREDRRRLSLDDRLATLGWAFAKPGM